MVISRATLDALWSQSAVKGARQCVPREFLIGLQKLGRFFVAHFVVSLQPIEQWCRFRIEAERL